MSSRLSSSKARILAELSFDGYLKFLEGEACVESNRSLESFHLNVKHLEEEMCARGYRNRYEHRVRALVDKLRPLEATEEDDAVKLLEQHLSRCPVTNGTAPVGCIPRIVSTALNPQYVPAVEERKERQFKPISVSATTKKQLENQQQQQEALTDELADLSKHLKSSVKNLSTAVTNRNAAIDQAQTGLEQSVDGAKSRVAAIEKTRKKMRMNTCFSILALLMVIAGFAAMVVFIRVTRSVKLTRWIADCLTHSRFALVDQVRGVQKRATAQ